MTLTLTHVTESLDPSPDFGDCAAGETALLAVLESRGLMTDAVREQLAQVCTKCAFAATFCELLRRYAEPSSVKRRIRCSMQTHVAENR